MAKSTSDELRVEIPFDIVAAAAKWRANLARKKGTAKRKRRPLMTPRRAISNFEVTNVEHSWGMLMAMEPGVHYRHDDFERRGVGNAWPAKAVYYSLIHIRHSIGAIEEVPPLASHWTTCVFKLSADGETLRANLIERRRNGWYVPSTTMARREYAARGLVGVLNLPIDDPLKNRPGSRAERHKRLRGYMFNRSGVTLAGELVRECESMPLYAVE